MLLAIDIGNTNITCGIFSFSNEIIHHWRLETCLSKTSEDYITSLHSLFNMHNLAFSSIQEIGLASVVPRVTETLLSGIEKYFSGKLYHITTSILSETILYNKIMLDNIQEIGVDRLLNIVGLHNNIKCDTIIVDFGTATTFDFINKAGEYYGGAITVGLEIFTHSLRNVTSRIPSVEFVQPSNRIGRNTIEALKVGNFYGYIGMVQNILVEMQSTHSTKPQIIATGGISNVIRNAVNFDICNEYLTLEGIQKTVNYLKNETNIICF